MSGGPASHNGQLCNVLSAIQTVSWAIRYDLGRTKGHGSLHRSREAHRHPLCRIEKPSQELRIQGGERPGPLRSSANTQYHMSPPRSPWQHFHTGVEWTSSSIIWTGAAGTVSTVLLRDTCAPHTDGAGSYCTRNRLKTKCASYPPSKILTLVGSPLLEAGASSSGFPRFSSSFSTLAMSFGPSGETSDGRCTYPPQG